MTHILFALFLLAQHTPSTLIQQIRHTLTQLEALMVPVNVNVTDTASLTAALAGTSPTITLLPGAYGAFTVPRAVTLKGTPGAVITGAANDLIVVSGNHVVLDGLTLLGTGDTKRGIRLDGADITVIRCRITNIRRKGQDSQAIAGWNGPGPYRIEDNDLEAASENILFGGADPTVVGTIPSDITIVNNRLTKPLAWCGGGWNVKNLLELKSARRVVITGNTLSGNCIDAQTGYAIVITPVNQDGKHPAAEVSDVRFEQNTITDSPVGVQMARGGYVLKNISFVRNSFTTTGTGRFFLLLGGMDGLVWDHNTIAQSGSSFIYGYSGTVTNFRFTGNLVRVSGIYGICTEGNCHGNLWAAYFTGGVIADNAFVAFPSPAKVPGNLFLAVTDPDPAGYGR